MLEYKKTENKNITVHTLALFRFFRISLLASTVNGAHISFDITVYHFGLTIGLNSWDLK